MGLEYKEPRLRRAREYHLYDQNGRRYLDLYLNNGRAIMGHRPGKFSHYLKNSLSRGMWADYPSEQLYKRLKTLLLKIFSGYNHVVIFRNPERAFQALNQRPADPLLSDQGNCWLYRPLLDSHPQGELLFLQPFLAGFTEMQIVLGKAELPEDDAISSVWLDGIVRLFHDFQQWMDLKPEFRDFKDIESLTQRGPYLCWKDTRHNYQKIRQQGLAKGFYLPPSQEYPLMIPAEMSDHEYKTLKQFLEESLARS